jgi:hypothetical protein
VQRGLPLRLLVEGGGEADGPALRRRRVHQLSDGREHGGDGIVVGGELLLDACFELIEAPGQILVRAQEFSQLHEGAHDVDPQDGGANPVFYSGDGALAYANTLGGTTMGDTAIGGFLARLPASPISTFLTNIGSSTFAFNAAMGGSATPVITASGPTWSTWELPILNWSRIVVSGLSQGAGMAAYIAKRTLVARVVLFSSPWDYERASQQLAHWIGEPSTTPPDRWFAEYHRRENTAALLVRSYKVLQIPADHVRIFDLGLPKDMKTKSDNPYHVSTVRKADYESEWQFLYGKFP